MDNAKQFLLICDQNGLQILENVLKGVQFIEVVGLGCTDRPDMLVLSTPARPIALIEPGMPVEDHSVKPEAV